MTYYTPEAYDSMPSLREAAVRFQEMQAMDSLMGPIRQFFLDSGMNERYGVCLLHKHFPMETNQRLVDVRNISSPWTVDVNDVVVPKYEGSIIPRTFKIFQGVFLPVEFGFSPCSPGGDSDHSFFVGFSALLQKIGLENVLGVRSLDTYTPDLSVEVTEGKTNIMIRRGSVKDSELIEALWVFSTDDDQRCHCREYCWKDSEGKHIDDHGCS